MIRLLPQASDIFERNSIYKSRYSAITLIAIASLSLTLGGCGNTPPSPDWLLNADSSLKSFAQAHLTGNTPVAEFEFRRAQREVSATGQPVLLLRTELTRCAVRQASLELDECPAAKALIPDAPATEQAYASYLRGAPLSIEQTALLPEAHRQALASADDGARIATLQTITDPLTRLIAASVMMRRNALPPEGVAVAVDTASEQGWRRPLLAWLGVQLKIAQAAGQSQEVARIQRRIAVALDGKPFLAP
ncbi:MAG: hypothetical protein RLZZ126_455 [Pseudomonadota bacterium]|jgi:hypothetical protein